MNPVRDTMSEYVIKTVAGVSLMGIKNKPTKHGCDPVRGPTRL